MKKERPRLRLSWRMQGTDAESLYFFRRKIYENHLDVTDETYLDEALAGYSNYNWKLGNPLAILEYGEAQNKNHFENSMLSLSIKPKFKFNDHLSLSEHFSYVLTNTNEKYYIP